MKARTVDDVREALGRVTTIMLNYVFADVDGRFGWQTGSTATKRTGVRTSGRCRIRSAMRRRS